MKSLFSLWVDVKVSHLNRLLRPFNVRLIEKRSKEWGDKVVITAQAIPDATADLIPPGGAMHPPSGPGEPQ